MSPATSFARTDTSRHLINLSPKEGIGDPSPNLGLEGRGGISAGVSTLVAAIPKLSKLPQNTETRDPGTENGGTVSSIQSIRKPPSGGILCIVSLVCPTLLSCQDFFLWYSRRHRVGGRQCSSRVVHRMILADHGMRMLRILGGRSVF
jgi:hypothetical protein